MTNGDLGFLLFEARPWAEDGRAQLVNPGSSPSLPGADERVGSTYYVHAHPDVLL